jgi:hypothetical protein
MYLETPLDRYEYMKMPIALFPADIIDHYGLNNTVLDGYVYMEIRKGMYGLPQAGVLANKLLKTKRTFSPTWILRTTPHARPMETCQSPRLVQLMCR